MGMANVKTDAITTPKKGTIPVHPNNGSITWRVGATIVATLFLVITVPICSAYAYQQHLEIKRLGQIAAQNSAAIMVEHERFTSVKEQLGTMITAIGRMEKQIAELNQTLKLRSMP
uniref:Uncharacterized protein n=1 Tax=viral metagenome TaxID=1070528 RepID=A0A6M3LIJ4_9ZZZZ